MPLPSEDPKRGKLAKPSDLSWLKKQVSAPDVQKGAKERSRSSSKALAERRVNFAAEEEVLDRLLSSFDDPKASNQDKQNAFMKSTIISQKAMLSGVGLIVDCLSVREYNKDKTKYKLHSITDVIDEMNETLFDAFGTIYEKDEKDKNNPDAEEKLVFQGDVLTLLSNLQALTDMQNVATYLIGIFQGETDEDHPFIVKDKRDVPANVFAFMEERLANMDFSKVHDRYERPAEEKDSDEGFIEENPQGEQKK
jgi:hypothetical protein